MSVLAQLADALREGSVEIVDLTAPLSSDTPILELPPQFGQTLCSTDSTQGAQNVHS